MKDVLELFSVWLTITLGLYLFGAFVAWDFDPGHWRTEGRFIISGLSLLVLCAMSTVFTERR